MDRLKKILSLRRGHGSLGEQCLYEEVLQPYVPTVMVDDKSFRLAYRIEVVDENGLVPPVLFSCHIDTVHRTEPLRIDNPALYDEGLNLFYKEDKEPLGADDGAGIWLLLEMIDAKVPGCYVFHRGEECGGIGAKGLAAHHRTWLTQFDMAIAFDRKGTGSVITHQGWGMCCSDKFATALAAQLNDHGLAYAPDNTGIYTDTAEYTDIIPECTNVSCGYDCEHTGNETLDVEHLMALRNALVAFDYKSLPIARKPGEDDFESTSWYKKYNIPTKRAPVISAPRDEFDLDNMSFAEITQWVRKADARDVADLLMQLSDDLIDATNYPVYEPEDDDDRLKVGMV